MLLVIIVIAAILYGCRRISTSRRRTWFIRLTGIVIGLRVGVALARTGAQWYVWAHDPLGKLLLPPTQSITVFTRYVWTHFWINVVISLGLGLGMALVLIALRKRNARFFEEGEVALGTLMAFTVGWPYFVIFFPLVFVLVVLLSVVRSLFFKESFTTLGVPFLVAALLALLFGMRMIAFLHLSALVI